MARARRGRTGAVAAVIGFLLGVGLLLRLRSASESNDVPVTTPTTAATRALAGAPEAGVGAAALGSTELRAVPNEEPADAGPAVPAAVPEGEAAAVTQALAWLQKNAEAAERHVDELCAESERLSAEPLFKPSARKRDAAAYLGVRVDWQNGRTGLLHLPGPLSATVDAAGSDWPSIPASSWQGLDFSWLRAVREFDSWTLSADGPLRDRDTSTLDDDAMPDATCLVQWSKLRLARGLQAGALAVASEEIRHLASLAVSTGTWWGGLTAEHLLQLDREAWRRADARPTEQVSEEQLARFRRVSNAAPLFLLPGVPEAVRKRALGCIGGELECSSISEALWLEPAVTRLTGARNDWGGAVSACDQQLFTRILAGPPPSLAEASQVFTANFGIEQSLAH